MMKPLRYVEPGDVVVRFPYFTSTQLAGPYTVTASHPARARGYRVVVFTDANGRRGQTSAHADSLAEVR